MYRKKVVSLALAAWTLASLTGCHTPAAPPANTANAATPVPPRKTTNQPPDAQTPQNQVTAITAGITGLLIEQATAPHSPLPKGVKLKNVTMDDNVATLDFSKEFQKLESMGESTGSQAQKLLAQRVEKVARVEKMRVTVEGQPYQDQAADWGQAYSVHDAARLTGGDSASAQTGSGGGNP